MVQTHVAQLRVREAPSAPADRDDAIPTLLGIVGAADVIPIGPQRGQIGEIDGAVGVLLECAERWALAAAEQLKVRQRRRAAVVPGRPSQIDALPFAQQFGEHGKLGYGYGSGGARRDRAWAGQGNGDGENVAERVQAGARHPSI